MCMFRFSNKSQHSLSFRSSNFAALDSSNVTMFSDDFLQKLSTHGLVELGTVLVTMDISGLYTSIPHDDGITATSSVLNTNNCQSPSAILQLIRFILDYNIFTIDNQFFNQTYGIAMGTEFAPQYANIFMHNFEQDVFAAQDFQSLLICSNEEERDGHLTVLKDTLIRTGYNAQLIDHQFRCAAARSNDLLRRQTLDATDRVPSSTSQE
ncbi:uncharacterized protein LOC122556358 [Chiloscyllium plagiosum]|uniref:uncharacterized protein LOC122556358 n=1 Tax=Chiloscyllium plagiosum TaxID=36176 RepID=UPI001CB84DEF|nr:uncharacterized protein LOC122556358 [Chiloscyllium plagiosum]